MKKERIKEAVIWILLIITIIIMIFITSSAKAQLNYLGEDISVTLKDIRYNNLTININEDGDIYYYTEYSDGIIIAFYVINHKVAMIRYIGFSHYSIKMYLNRISGDGATFNGKYWMYNNLYLSVYESSIRGNYVMEFYKKE